MGNIPTYEYDEGGNCAACFGVGKEFGEVSTPGRIKAIFSGIIICPGVTENPNQSWILTQFAGCEFRNTEGGNMILYHFCVNIEGADIALCLLYLHGWDGPFFRSLERECAIILNNQTAPIACEGLFISGHGGQCEITWGPEI